MNHIHRKLRKTPARSRRMMSKKKNPVACTLTNMLQEDVLRRICRDIEARWFIRIYGKLSAIAHLSNLRRMRLFTGSEE